jgi:uncharacterized protein YhfF
MAKRRRDHRLDRDYGPPWWEREPQPRVSSDGGPATNSQNQPVQDPTLNVKELNAAGIATEAALREMSTAHLTSFIEIESRHTKELREAESGRLDAIRAVDQANVARAQEVSSAQAAALATSVIQSAEALRVQVEATRITTQDQLETALGPIRTQVESLRQTQFQQQGEKAAVTEGTGDDRFLKVYQQSQDQFVATMRQAREEAAAADARARADAAQRQEQFIAVLTQSKAATHTTRTGWIIGSIIAGATSLILLMSLIITLFASGVL